MSDESATKPCAQCGNEISSTVRHCPVCGSLQEDVAIPEPVPSGFSSFAIEGEDTPEQATPPEPEEPEAKQPVSSEDVPVQDVDELESEDVSTATVRMSIADMGKAWVEETATEPGDAPPPEPTPEPKRRGCLPMLAVLIALPSAAVLAVLLT